MVEPNEVAARIRAGIPDAEVVEVEDMTGTRDHFRAIVVAASFASLGPVEQHRVVYRALGELMTGPIHALALSTFTPDGWARQRGR